MQNYLNITVNDKGNLEITATSEGIEYLQEQVERDIVMSDPETQQITWKQTNTAMWVDMLESHSCNGSYSLIPTGLLGLTDAPGISEETILPDDENDSKYIIPEGLGMWYFPDYMVTDEFQKLLAGETIVFMAVPVESDATFVHNGKTYRGTLAEVTGAFEQSSYNMQQTLEDYIENECEEVHDITKENIIVLRKMFNSNDYSRYTRQQMQNEWYRRAEVREAEEAKKLTTSQKLQFILKNDPDNEKYEIAKIYESSFCKALCKAMPYTHFSYGKNYILRYQVDFEATIAQEKKRFEEHIKKDLKITVGDFGLYYYHSSLFKSYWFSKEADKPGQYRMDSKGYIDLARLIMFLTDAPGTYYPDYSKVNAFLDTNKVGYNNSDAYKYTMENITVQRFANGRLDIKGLTKSQEGIINHLIELHAKLRNK